MIVQGYCGRHGYTDGDVGVSSAMEHADNHQRIGRIVVGRIVVGLELPKGALNDKMEAVKRVTERCAIHETLKSPPGLRIDNDIRLGLS